jgi:hypothetical protein
MMPRLIVTDFRGGFGSLKLGRTPKGGFALGIWQRSVPGGISLYIDDMMTEHQKTWKRDQFQDDKK